MQLPLNTQANESGIAYTQEYTKMPDAMTKNEINFITTGRKHIFRDVSALYWFNTGSDNRLVRGFLNINFKAEHVRMTKSRL